MGTIIDLENIRINQRAKDWKEAIRVAGEPLVQCDSIDAKYIEQMIESVETLGPYIVIMPGFALAHAAPGNTVKKSDVSIATFTDNIDFHTDNDPVRVVLCLACVDKTSHLDKMKNLATRLMSDGIVEQMYECTSAEELYTLING